MKLNVLLNYMYILTEELFRLSSLKIISGSKGIISTLCCLLPKILSYTFNERLISPRSFDQTIDRNNLWNKYTTISVWRTGQ